MELSPREVQVAEAIHAGKKRGDIAKSMGISPGTLQNYVQSCYAKLGIGNERELVLWVERGKVGIRS